MRRAHSVRARSVGLERPAIENCGGSSCGRDIIVGKVLCFPMEDLRRSLSVSSRASMGLVRVGALSSRRRRAVLQVTRQRRTERRATGGTTRHRRRQRQRRARRSGGHSRTFPPAMGTPGRLEEWKSYEVGSPAPFHGGVEAAYGTSATRDGPRAGDNGDMYVRWLTVSFWKSTDYGITGKKTKKNSTRSPEPHISPLGLCSRGQETTPPPFSFSLVWMASGQRREAPRLSILGCGSHSRYGGDDDPGTTGTAGEASTPSSVRSRRFATSH